MLILRGNRCFRKGGRVLKGGCWRLCEGWGALGRRLRRILGNHGNLKFFGVSLCSLLFTARSSADGVCIGALHHVKEQRTVPFNRLQTLDQVGRRVVELLVEEGQAAADHTRKSAAKWTGWMDRVKGWTNSKTLLDETRSDALLHGFDQ